MSSISDFPSLILLQSSLAQAVGTMPSAAAEQALLDVREVPGFQHLSSLYALATQESLSRMVVNPALFDEVSKAASVFGDLPALKETFSLPTLEERLEVCAQVLDLRRGVQVFSASEQQPGEGEAKRFVESALQTVGKSMSRALKDELSWPDELSLRSIGAFAASIRKIFDTREDHLSAEQRYHLMRLASYVGAAAPEICRFERAEIHSPVQAVKIASLIEVLYACGFGNERLLGASERLYRLPRAWDKIDPSARDAAFRLAAEEVERVLSEEKAADGSLNLGIRAGSSGVAFPLRQHLASLKLA